MPQAAPKIPWYKPRDSMGDRSAMIVGATAVEAISPSVQMATLTTNKGKLVASAVEPYPNPSRKAATATVSKRGHFAAILLTGMVIKITKKPFTAMAVPY